MTTVTRVHLANAVYREIGLSQAESSDLVDAILDEMIKCLEASEEVKLSSFGTFSIRQKRERMGRNPKTKVEIPISPRKVVSFRASNLLTKRLNKTSSN